MRAFSTPKRRPPNAHPPIRPFVTVPATPPNHATQRLPRDHVSPCARGCCWVPMAGVCARNRSCACHWDEHRPATNGGDGRRYNDPTANTAIRNVMKENPR